MPAGTGSQKRIRDLQRAIQRAGADADRVAALQQRIAEIEKEPKIRYDPAKRKKNEQKYQLVKFVERKKLVRSIQSTMKQIEQTEDDETKQSLETKLQGLHDDLGYVL